MRRELRTRRRGPQHWCLRMVLALLIALTPLVSLAASMAMPSPDHADTQSEAAPMPCHDAAAIRAADTADCPHCSGDATAAQCHCSAVPMPGGVTTSVLPLPGDSTGNGVSRTMTSDALPDSPGELLFRPPIPSHA